MLIRRSPARTSWPSLKWTSWISPVTRGLTPTVAEALTLPTTCKRRGTSARATLRTCTGAGGGPPVLPSSPEQAFRRAVSNGSRIRHQREKCFMIVPETGAWKRASASAARRSGHLLKVNHALRFVRGRYGNGGGNRMNRAKRKYSSRQACAFAVILQNPPFRAAALSRVFAALCLSILRAKTRRCLARPKNRNFAKFPQKPASPLTCRRCRLRSVGIRRLT